MNFNHDHNEIMNTHLGITDPRIGFICSLILLITGNNLPEVTHHISNFEIPKGVMQVGQLIAWISAGGLFLLSLAKFIIDMFKTFKRKKDDAAEQS